MNKVIALWLGVLALAVLLPAEVYCQNTTTLTTTSHATTTTGMSSAAGSAVTTSMHLTTTPKGHGNVLHVPTSLFLVIASASLLRLW